MAIISLNLVSNAKAIYIPDHLLYNFSLIKEKRPRRDIKFFDFMSNSYPNRQFID